MSRPPGRDNHTQLGDQYYDHPIDFIGNQYDPVDCHNSYIMAKAGFPGYANYSTNQMPQGYAVNAGYVAPAYATGQQQVIAAGYPQGYAQTYPQTYAQGYPQTTIAAPMVTPAPQTASYTQPYTRPLESEAAVQERIKANIDAIMETQKTAMLNSKLETLANKVQSLAQNIEQSESSKVRSLSEKVDRLSQNLSGESDGHIKALSDKVDRLSRSLEQRPAATESLSSTAPNSDDDIARRLRRLAAESSARQARSEERIPDW